MRVLQMNNFTKAELEIIKYWCQLEPNITKKIQSMIDNYCEHESKEEIKKTFCCGEKLFYASVDWSIAKCSKCGRNLNDNQ